MMFIINRVRLSLIRSNPV